MHSLKTKQFGIRFWIDSSDDWWVGRSSCYKAGRLTLTRVKNTLSSLPIYFLSFVIPTSVRLRLEKLERDLLWKGQGEDRKYHLVKWDLVCSNVKRGGLGIKNLKSFNSALLGKWLWHFLTNSLGMWRKVVVCKYGEEEHKWFPKTISSPYGLGFWKGILKGWDSFVRHIHFVIGDGSTVRFWNDKWCSEMELWRAFPRLYSLALEKECLINSVMQVSEDTVVWNPISGGIFKTGKCRCVRIFLSSFIPRKLVVAVRIR